MNIDKPALIMRRQKGGLSPVTSFDAELLDAYGFNADLEVTIKQRRSIPQLRLYWKMLHVVCQNTDGWPTAKHLHKSLKETLGYVVHRKRIDGTWTYDVDSMSIPAKDGAEFKLYMDLVVRLISEQVLPGVDPMALLNECVEVS